MSVRKKKSARMYSEVIEDVRAKADQEGLPQYALIEAAIDKAAKNRNLLRLHIRAEVNGRGGRGRESNKRQYALFLTDAHHEKLCELAGEQCRRIGTVLEAAIHLYFKGVEEKPGEIGLLFYPLNVGVTLCETQGKGFRRLGAIPDKETVFVEHKTILFGVIQKSEGNMQPVSAQCWQLLGKCRNKAVKGVISISEIDALLKVPTFRAALESRWKEWSEEKASLGQADKSGCGYVEMLLTELGLSIIGASPKHFTAAYAHSESLPLITRVDIEAARAQAGGRLTVASVSSVFDELHSDEIQVFKPDDL